MSDVLVEERVQLRQAGYENDEVIYPDSDGAPMGETEYHVIAILDLLSSLRQFLRNTPDVYVIADMFMYYQQGNPRAVVAPDVMVIKGVSKRKRRSFKVWEEKAVPCIIFEVSSKSTLLEDTKTKSHLYASLGVREYFLFDPLQEYIETGLAGFRLKADEYAPIQSEGKGVFFSEELNAFLMVEDDRLRLIDSQTHKPVPDLDEALSQLETVTERAEQEAQRAEREAQRAERERCRAEQAEAELARLRELLKEH